MTAAHRVLIVDDEPHIRLLLRTTLERAGYEVAEAGSGRHALELLEGLKPEVVLLDLGLPDRDGLELVPLLRRRGATIVILSAREATEQKVAALDLGADDYVTKPFDSEELLARVRAALRHRLSAQGARPVFRAAGLAVDLVDRRIVRDGQEVRLTPKEYAVLEELAKFPGRVITHARLLGSVWAQDEDRHIEYLRVVIRNLRQKIEPDPSRPSVIVNELGVGYRLIGSSETA